MNHNLWLARRLYKGSYSSEYRGSMSECVGWIERHVSTDAENSRADITYVLSLQERRRNTGRRAADRERE